MGLNERVWRNFFTAETSAEELDAAYPRGYPRSSDHCAAIIAHPNCPTTVLDEATTGYLGFKHNSKYSWRSSILTAVASRTHNTDTMWDALYACGDTRTLVTLAQNPDTPQRILLDMSKRRSHRNFLEALSQNPAATVTILTNVIRRTLGATRGIGYVIPNILNRDDLDADDRAALLDVLMSGWRITPKDPHSRLNGSYHSYGVNLLSRATLDPAHSDVLAFFLSLHDPRLPSPPGGPALRIVEHVMSNSCVSTDLMEQLWDWAMLRRAHPAPPVAMYQRGGDDFLETTILRNPNCPPRILSEAAYSGRYSLMMVARSHPNLPEDAAVIIALTFARETQIGA